MEMVMDHVVYLDYQAKELDNLLSGKKTMIIRGAAGRKMPYGRVFQGDNLYFINNNGEGLIRAKAIIKRVSNSNKLSEQESVSLIEMNQDKLQLSAKQYKRWAGKRFLVLVEVEKVEELEPFTIDKSNYGNMDDWLVAGDIQSVKN
jgi:hypothetical protein